MLTPSQTAFHEAHKARQRRFAVAADRYKWNSRAKSDNIVSIHALPKPPVRRQYETKGRSAFTPLYQRILGAVAAEYGMSISELTGPLRKARHCQARFVAVGLLVEMTQMSTPAIGRRFGNRDHTTILHAREQAKKLFASEAFRNRVDQIKDGITSMTTATYPTARLAYLTRPDSETVLLNLQFDREASRVIEIDSSGQQIERVRINRDQLANIIKDGVGVLG